jgi:putative solute:sodium symporter small subunit
MSSSSPNQSNSKQKFHRKSEHYWVKSLQVVMLILTLWLLVSLGCGILFRDWLDATLPHVGGAPFGFWMAQQGSIIGFLLLLLLYMLLMNRLDRQHGYDGDHR